MQRVDEAKWRIGGGVCKVEDGGYVSVVTDTLRDGMQLTRVNVVLWQP